MQLALLLFLHHLADVAFQPSWLIENKKKHLWAIYEHVFVWTGVVSLGFYLTTGVSIQQIVFLFVGHFIIDYFFYQVMPKDKNYNWVVLDQALHYGQILFAYFLM